MRVTNAMSGTITGAAPLSATRQAILGTDFGGIPLGRIGERQAQGGEPNPLQRAGRALASGFERLAANVARIGDPPGARADRVFRLDVRDASRALDTLLGTLTESRTSRHVVSDKADAAAAASGKRIATAARDFAAAAARTGMDPATFLESRFALAAGNLTSDTRDIVVNALGGEATARAAEALAKGTKKDGVAAGMLNVLGGLASHELQGRADAETRVAVDAALDTLLTKLAEAPPTEARALHKYNDTVQLLGGRLATSGDRYASVLQQGDLSAKGAGRFDRAADGTWSEVGTRTEFTGAELHRTQAMAVSRAFLKDALAARPPAQRDLALSHLPTDDLVVLLASRPGAARSPAAAALEGAVFAEVTRRGTALEGAARTAFAALATAAGALAGPPTPAEANRLADRANAAGAAEKALTRHLDHTGEAMPFGVPEARAAARDALAAVPTDAASAAALPDTGLGKLRAAGTALGAEGPLLAALRTETTARLDAAGATHTAAAARFLRAVREDGPEAVVGALAGLRQAEERRVEAHSVLDWKGYEADKATIMRNGALEAAVGALPPDGRAALRSALEGRDMTRLFDMITDARVFGGVSSAVMGTWLDRAQTTLSTLRSLVGAEPPAHSPGPADAPLVSALRRHLALPLDAGGGVAGDMDVIDATRTAEIGALLQEGLDNASRQIPAQALGPHTLAQAFVKDFGRSAVLTSVGQDMLQPGIPADGEARAREAADALAGLVDAARLLPASQLANQATFAALKPVFTDPSVFAALERGERGAGGEIQLTDAMIKLNAHQPFHGVRFDGKTYDTGSKLGFLAANVAFAMARPELAEGLREELRKIVGTI